MTAIPRRWRRNRKTATATASRTRLSDNYDTFLVLLTAQLQNQDPLAPMDSTQFTQQLVQFSQVEQQIRTNEQLEGLVGQYQAATAGAALSYLGKDAIIAADETYLAGGEANWAYRCRNAATIMTITVKDSQRTHGLRDRRPRRAALANTSSLGMARRPTARPRRTASTRIRSKPRMQPATDITPTITRSRNHYGRRFLRSRRPSSSRRPAHASLDTIRSVLDNG